MAENETLKVNIEDNGQNKPENNFNKLSVVHELIEIIASCIALFVPVIIMLLWLHRLAICSFYDLPIFYSSLNINRLLPVFLIVLIFGLGIWLNSKMDKEYMFLLKSINDLDNNDKKRTRHKKEKTFYSFSHAMLLLLSLFLVILMPAALLFEMDSMYKGTYPLLYQNSKTSEIAVVFASAVVVIILSVGSIIVLARWCKNTDQIQKEIGTYFSRILDNKRTMIIESEDIKRLIRFHIEFLAGFSVVLLIIMILFMAQASSYFKTRYYLVQFDNNEYAVVLDTDDYYIGEPIEITELENERKLVIHTDAYIYLDKAENPTVVHKESFDSVTMMRE